MFEGERARGIFGYIGAALVANYANVLLSKTNKLTITQSSFLAIYVFGNLIVYSFDILFAKEKFYLSSYKGVSSYYGEVPYTDINTRGFWLINSFYQKYFFRFLVTVVIDVIIGLNLLQYTVSKLDQLDILTKWKYRNLVVAAIVSAFTYFLYLGTLRFEWAYQYKENTTMNILVMIWVSLALLIYATSPNVLNKNNTSIRWRNMY